MAIFLKQIFFLDALSNVLISEISMEAVYSNEKSNLNPLKEFLDSFLSI